MSLDTPHAKPLYNVKNPFIARLKRAHDLSAPGAPKHTRHFEIDLSGSGLEYVPGDSLAVQPTNDPALVDEMISILGLTGHELVNHPKKDVKVALRTALIEGSSITEVDNKLIKAIVEKTGGATPLAPLAEPEQKEELKKYLYGRFVIDLLIDNPAAKFEAQEFVSLLKKLNIRLYSISSSLKAHPEEVHLTVAAVKYTSAKRVPRSLNPGSTSDAPVVSTQTTSPAGRRVSVVPRSSGSPATRSSPERIATPSWSATVKRQCPSRWDQSNVRR